MSNKPAGGDLSVYYHTHWDREWYLPFRAYQVRLADVVDEVMTRLEHGELPCFMLDGQTVVLEDYLELRPENRDRLKALVLAGKLSIGPWFVMPDEFLVSGESLIRNLVRGIEESRQWGCTRFTGYLPDTFGHSADIPTLLTQCGIDSAVVWRGINPTQSLFQWQSPSGASVCTLHLTDGYFQMMLDDWTLTPTQKTEALQGLVHKLEAAQPSSVSPAAASENGAALKPSALMPIGGDHMGLVPSQGRALLLEQYPRLTETTPDRYLAALPAALSAPGSSPLETVRGELTDNTGSFLLPGVYSSRLYLKQANRQLEHRLVHRLEPLLAMTQALLPENAHRYPAQELDLSWKTLMLNHPHDSICGCSVDAVHRENEVRFDHVRQLADALLDRATHALCEVFSIPGYWIIFNTGDQPYTGVIEVTEDCLDSTQASALIQQRQVETVLQDSYRYDHHRIPMAHLTQQRRTGWVWGEDIPAFGIQMMPKTQSSAYSPVLVEQGRLQNARLIVQLLADGRLNITDRQTGTQYNGLLQFRDLAEQGDSYNSAPIPGTKAVLAVLSGVRVVAEGPLVGILEVRYTLPTIPGAITTRIRLDADSPMVQFETRFTNQATGHKLQVGFSTGKPVNKVFAESHLSIVERGYEPDYREVDAMPVDKMKELKTNTGPVQRFFSTNGQSWLTEGLTEYEVQGDTLYITLLRTFDMLSKADTGVRGAQAGPPLPTPEGNCLNRPITARYAWLPTPEANTTLYQATGRFYGTVWGQNFPDAPHPTTPADVPESPSLISWEAGTLVASACYWSPGKGLVLRLLNPSRQTIATQIRTGFTYRQLHRANFLEAIQETLPSPRIEVAPQGVLTLLFEV
jgi:mannosylglycerate hydrolase